MKKHGSIQLQLITVLLVSIVALTTGCHHGARPDLSGDPVAQYDYGQSRKPLTAVEQDIRTATPEELEEIEDRMLAIIESPNATYAGKEFACRMLRRMGSKDCVSVLADCLYDKELSDMARFALQGMPYSKVDKELRRALTRLEGEQQIGVISTLAARGDEGAVPQIADLADTNNEALREACILALERIGGSRAERALSEIGR